MNDNVRNALWQILQSHGRSLIDDPRRCEGLLRDVCPGHKREVHVLAGALREGVPADLLGSVTRAAPKAAVERLARKLQQNLALAPDAAWWAVESWAVALGVLSAEALRSRTSPAVHHTREAAGPIADPVRTGGKPGAESAAAEGKQPGNRRIVAVLVVLLIAGGGVVAYVSLKPRALDELKDRSRASVDSTLAPPASTGSAKDQGKPHERKDHLWAGQVHLQVLAAQAVTLFTPPTLASGMTLLLAMEQFQDAVALHLRAADNSIVAPPASTVSTKTNENTTPRVVEHDTSPSPMNRALPSGEIAEATSLLAVADRLRALPNVSPWKCHCSGLGSLELSPPNPIIG